MHLSDYTFVEVEQTVTSTSVGVIVPLGATEQHGPHLPLDVDSIIASAVADAVADRLTAGGHTCVVAPVLPFGDSGHHTAFAGSVAVRRTVLVDVLKDMCESLFRTPFAWVALITGHAGNCPAMRDVASAQCSGPVISVDDWPAIRAAIHQVAHDDLGLDAAYVGTHAGHFETSIMLHLRPTSVAMDRAQAGAIGDPTDLGPRLRDEGMLAVSPNGVIGDPTQATAQSGKMYLDALISFNEAFIGGRLSS